MKQQCVTAAKSNHGGPWVHMESHFRKLFAKLAAGAAVHYEITLHYDDGANRFMPKSMEYALWTNGARCAFSKTAQKTLQEEETSPGEWCVWAAMDNV